MFDFGWDSSFASDGSDLEASCLALVTKLSLATTELLVSCLQTPFLSLPELMAGVGGKVYTYLPFHEMDMAPMPSRPETGTQKLES